MKTCEHYKEQFIEALYDELNAQEKKSFFEHIATCTECSTAYNEMNATLLFMDKRKRVEPNEQFWTEYWKGIDAELGIEPLPKPKEKKLILTTIFSRPAWAYSVAALLFIGIGLYFGRLLYAPSETVNIASNQTLPGVEDSIHQNIDENQTLAPDIDMQNKNKLPVTLARSVVDNEAHEYLQRSKILLLGLINGTDEGSDDISNERKISRSLLKQAADLKPKLTNPNQQRVKQLINQLEIILLQLANLEEQNDLPAVDLIRKGVDQNAILLRINLEEMRKSDSKHSSSKPDSTKYKKQS